MTDSEIELDYAYLTQQALRSVIRDVLTITAELGDVPGEHHFYIEFLTRNDGVQISPELLESYPDRMTIVLQHIFEDLKIHDDRFEVTLHFNNQPEHLIIPFAAITNFVDPSVEFALRFEPVGAANEATEADDSQQNEEPEQEAEIKTFAPEEEAEKKQGKEEDKEKPEGSADVVSLDSFRKK